jgi:hypothetical protein
VRWRTWFAAVSSLWLLASCTAPISSLPPLAKDDIEAEKRRQQVAQIKDYFGLLHRLDTVAFRLRTANRADCKGWESAQIGLYAATPRSLPRKYQSYASEALGIRWVRATVISVVDGSPAANARLEAGDELMTINNEPVPVTQTMGWIGGFLRYNGERPIQINFKRDGEDKTVTVYPVVACAIPIELQTVDDVNAVTTAEGIIVNSAIAKLAKTDDQLAVIVGHEMAHANLGHLDKKEINELIGAAGGLAIDGGFLMGGISTGGAFTRAFGAAGARIFSVDFEREADYFGAYYAARAGYRIAGTEQFWWEMGQLHPDSIRFATTHPATPERFLQMQKVAAEIAGKIARHEALEPELKVRRAANQPSPPDNTR